MADGDCVANGENTWSERDAVITTNIGKTLQNIVGNKHRKIRTTQKLLRDK